MKTFIITCFLIVNIAMNAQTNKIDESLLNNKNWIQADESPTGLDTPMNAERDGQYKSNKLAFYKVKKWGSFLDNKNEFIVGNWEVKNNQIILYDIYPKGKGFNCEIVELTKDGLTVSYLDLYKTPRKIKLIPA